MQKTASLPDGVSNVIWKAVNLGFEPGSNVSAAYLADRQP